MRLTLPLTGTVLVEGSVYGDGELVGDDKDPIRPVDINLGNVSWRMVDVDMENEVMVIEVEAAEEVRGADTGQVDGHGNPIFTRRKSTAQDKAALLNHARGMVEGKSKDELYSMSKCAKLKRGGAPQ